jgi:cytochrome b6-f complex iron-sulfur subunit
VADPVANSEGQFWIANMDPAETGEGGSGGADGLLALWRKCPTWVHGAVARHVLLRGHAAVGTAAPATLPPTRRRAIRVFGPAPRSMDTMAIEIDDAGNITVQTGSITPGGPDNPERAVPGLDRVRTELDPDAARRVMDA